MVDGPYRVVRVPVWGHDDQFGVAASRGLTVRGGVRRVQPLKSYDAADKLRDRMNADYQRYEWALWAKRGA